MTALLWGAAGLPEDCTWTVWLMGSPAAPWWIRGPPFACYEKELPEDWTPTNTELLTVTGERTVMPGKKLLSVVVGTCQTRHEFWLADIRDECIVGLDLLAHWGTRVNVPGAALCLGNETVPLRLGRSRHGEAATPQPPPRHQCSPAPAPSRSTKAAETQGEPCGSIVAQTSTSQPLPPHTPSAPRHLRLLLLLRSWGGEAVSISMPQQEQLQHLLRDFVDIFAAREEDCTRTALVQHHIDTGTAAPIRLRPHRLPLAKRQAAEEMIRDMAANSIIEPSDSPWAAPIVMVRKKMGGGWRPCVDFRRLNAVTRKDSYPLPRIDDALDYVAGSCWFRSLDLRSGYWQVELASEARPKNVFTIGQGLWQFRVMPFGLCNAPATFERLMERVLNDIPRTRCVVYLDDLLVHARDCDQAVHNLREVLTAIRSAGLRLNPAKCNLLTR